MTDQELRKQLSKGKIEKRYLLIGNEPLLINNTIDLLKKSTGVDESFDFDKFSITEISLDEIIEKLYTTPFGGNQRLILIKHLEELDKKSLAKFAQTINNLSFYNCLVMTYILDKDNQKSDRTPKTIANLFKKTQCVTYPVHRDSIRKWIMTKVRRDNLQLSPAIIRYLEEEFSNDITGLKNELTKIENYLYETHSKSTDAGIKELAQGLCDFNKYKIVNMFFNGRSETLRYFEEIKPYLHSYPEIVYALTRGLVYYLQRENNIFSNNKNGLSAMLDDLTVIDQGIKRSSHFVSLMLEILFLTRREMFQKGGAGYAR